MSDSSELETGGIGAMRVPLTYGAILGVVVGALGFVLATFGLHTNVALPLVFVGLATIINVVMVFLALRETASTTAWAGQLLNGLVLGVVGAVIVFASSWVMTALVFPDYNAEFASASRAALEASGLPAEQVEAQMTPVEQATPASSALSGAVGTVLTSVVAAAVIGIFKRKAG